MTPKTIHLVFKTHLDIGFTDLAARVRRQYHERFIPQALDTAEHFHAENPAEPLFVWTTGAWLIHDHLATRSGPEVARLERAIRAGLIRWHALPFTTHSELMSPALFRAGLSYSAELDRRFGMVTRAAKITDVPGHTLGIVPLLAAAAVRFLHLGVNTASPVPDVPDVFRWRAPNGSEVIVMYQASYGETHLPAGMEDALSFAHTADNIGPQSVAQAVVVHRELAAQHPGARVRAATLEDYAALLWDRRETLPVVTQEIGDSWIHGAASDPAKLARFRALQRLYDRFEAEGLDDARLEFGRRLCLVAEHTWGADIKTYLRDEAAWDRPAFDSARRSDPRFAFCEASWAEQRDYLDDALAALPPPDRARAAEAEAALAAPPAVEGAALTGPATVGGWTVEPDPETGDLLRITAPDGLVLEGGDGPLISYRHAAFDAADVRRHLDTYLVDRPEWAILDHDKPGLNRAETATSATFRPIFRAATQADGRLEIRAEMPPVAHRELGAPSRLRWHAAADGDALRLTLVLEGKPANRIPEAGSVTIAPAGACDWRLLKSGLWIDPTAVAARAGGGLHGLFAARARTAAGTLDVEPLDCALAGPERADFMRFGAAAAPSDAGLRFFLYNNKWGTNFPMWWAGDAAFRWTIRARRD